MLYAILFLPLLPFLAIGRQGLLGILSVASPLLSLALLPLGLHQASGPLRMDEVGAFFLALTDLLYTLTALFAPAYFRAHHGEAWRFFAAGSLFLFALHGAYLSYNLGFLWIFVEGSTLASALLVYHKGGGQALEATWKYLLLGSVGIALGLLGVILVYALLGGKTLDWLEAKRLAAQLKPEELRLAFALLLIGFGTKVGLFPMQAWLPDAHAEAPGPASTLLSGTLLNVAFYALLRYAALMEAAGLGTFARGFFLAFGLATLLASALFLFRQEEYKRHLAYSSMEHMGLAVFALGLGAPWLALFHLLAHSLAKSAAFLGASALLARFHTPRIREVGGLVRAWPALGFAWVLALLALGGLPPFGLFFAELQAVQLAPPGLAALYLLGIALAFAGILPALAQMGFGPSRDAFPSGEQAGVSPLPFPLGVVFFLLLLALLLGVFPPVEGFKTLEVTLWRL